MLEGVADTAEREESLCHTRIIRRPSSRVTRTALVAGATGLVGSHVVRQLLGERAYTHVTALVRRALPPHKKLTSRVIDFDRLAELADFPRVDDVFCCLGTTIRTAGSRDAFRRVDLTYVHQLAVLAARHRAGRFLLVSALGADPQSRVFYNKVKGEAEVAARREMTNVHIFRPSLLRGKRAEARPLERIAIVLSLALFPFMLGRLRPYRVIKAETVARAMVRVALDETPGPRVYLSHEIRPLLRRGTRQEIGRPTPPAA